MTLTAQQRVVDDELSVNTAAVVEEAFV